MLGGPRLSEGRVTRKNVGSVKGVVRRGDKSRGV
jgi:hypothetical protein